MEFFQNINTFLVDKIGPLGPLIAVGSLGFLLILLALPTMLKKQIDPLSRLRESAGLPSGSKRETKTVAKGGTLRQGKGSIKLDRFAGFLEPKNEEELSSARLKMMRAGYRGKNAVRTFHAIQFAMGLFFLLMGVIYALVTAATGEISTRTLVLSVLLPGSIGYYMPRYWVERRLQMRHEEMQNGFPDALDMLLVCVEAGQSLDQAIIRVSKELHAGFPALASEFDIVANEVKAGKEKAGVLRAFAERTGVSDISSFVTVMIQSQTFGTSIAEALRVYAAEMRDKRVMRAEEKANKLPTKMTLGTMMFTVPPLLIILVGPSVYDMMQVFSAAALPGN